MASKKTTKQAEPKAKKPAAKAKAAKAPKADAKPAAPRHPHGRLVAAHGSKEALAKTLAASLARDDEDQGVIAARLGKASNQQLLRLEHVVETVKAKYGSRDKLIAAIGTAEKKTKDKDYLATLEASSLPKLLDLAAAHAHRARV